MTVSTRAEVITRRTYCRPLNEEGTKFETWEQVIDRVIFHQKWLWERALTHKKIPGLYLGEVTENLKEWVRLNKDQEAELEELRQLFLERKALPSGRTLWLGGTELSRKRESSMFNCSFENIETIYDLVDMFWLLLQGCGVGGAPKTGTLTGFRSIIPHVKIINSTREGVGGNEFNEESFDGETWTLVIGDSAESWAKSLGKLLAGKYKAKKLVIDLRQIRGSGIRLKGYGWISSGSKPLGKAYEAIAEIMNRRAGSLLRKMDILDICNHLGTVLSSRRSAEIMLMDANDIEVDEFAAAKVNCFTPGWKHRQQSNNSIVFYDKPSKEKLTSLFNEIVSNGGSEPGFINGKTAVKRAPYFQGVNPCAEILLGSKSFCNLTEIDVSKFKGDNAGLLKTAYLIGRANYRQTVVDFRDGILQEAWHLNNEFLHLCGVGVTGIVHRDDLTEYDWKQLKYAAINGTRSIADELDLPYAKNVTTLKPSGTLSKIMDTTEGVHKPLGKYIFNWVNFSKNDPIVDKMYQANYRVLDNPSDDTSALVCMPVCNEGINFTRVEVTRKNGDTVVLEVNKESAVEQLDRYKKLQLYYCEQNVSNTISYDPSEVADIVDWLLENWDIYVGVSFLFRADPTLSAKDLGYEYLPQEVVTKERYDKYVASLDSVDFTDTNTLEELNQDECASGACPIK